MYSIDRMGKKLNAAIRKKALSTLDTLSKTNNLKPATYNALKNQIDNSRIDAVKRLQQNFDVVNKSKSKQSFTKGSLSSDVKVLKEKSRQTIASLTSAGKKRYSYITDVSKFNKERAPVTITNITATKLKGILNKVDTRKGVKLTAGNKTYILKPSNVKQLANNINDLFVNETNVQGSDVDIIQEILNLNQVKIEPFEYHKDKNQGGFFKYYNNTTIDLTKFQIYTEKQQDYKENCFVYALMVSGALTDEEINSIKFMCAGLYVPCNKILVICTKFNLTIRVKVIEDRNKTHADIKTYGKGERVITIGLIEKHYFYIKEIPYTLYSIKHYEELKDVIEYNKIKDSYNKKTAGRFTDSFQAIKYMYENKEYYFTDMPYDDMLDTQYADVEAEITTLEYDPLIDIKSNGKYVKKINGNKIEMYHNGSIVELKYQLVFFDFETITSGDNHEAYLVSNSETKTNYGKECGRTMLYDLCYKYPDVDVFTLVAHNAGYDFRFMIKHLFMESEITSGKKLLEAKGLFYYAKGKSKKIIIKDSYSICGLSLANWGKAMKVPSEKEIMPYGLYTKENVNIIKVPIETVKSACIAEYKKKKYCEGIEATDIEATTFFNAFMVNADKWNCIFGDKINIVEYSKRYCDIDIAVLKECYTKMRTICLDTFDIDILDCMSSSQLAQRFMEVNGVFDDVTMVSSTPREYMMKCIEGGRVMCADNVKHNIELNVADFDAVSLYPSAMHRLSGYLKGDPKVLKDLSYDFLQKCDGYFIQIIIKTLKTKRSFSLMSDKNDNDIRVFDNDLPKKMYVCKQKLEDLIEFQGITFDIINGYYYDEGRNYKLREVIQFAFNERKKLKAEGNPLQEVYKLIMNGAYGKTLQGAYDEQVIFKYGEDKLQDYISKNYNYIDNYITFDDGDYKKYRVQLTKPINSVFNNVPCGVEVLGMSKRIMNEVMCLAEDNDMKIYYQDTDSMHLEDRHINLLAKLYQAKYNRQLIGKEMGQFHSDFSSDKITKNIIAIKSIFLGKKAYVDVLEGEDKNGDIVQDYHIRMKGVSDKAIKYYCLINKITPYELYQQLCNGKKIKFDLTCDGNACSFEYNKDYTISSNSAFIREVSF